ncbi:MAG: hypothetical protein Q7S62_02440 [bacterium]|nr:hypothetical protein [bacterium]
MYPTLKQMSTGKKNLLGMRLGGLYYGTLELDNTRTYEPNNPILFLNPYGLTIEICETDTLRRDKLVALEETPRFMRRNSEMCSASLIEGHVETQTRIPLIVGGPLNIPDNRHLLSHVSPPIDTNGLPTY